MRYPVTPDGRYFVVRGRLWRMSDPSLSDERREALVKALMSARRVVREARGAGDAEALAAAHARVDEAKRGLGEAAPCGGRTMRPTSTGTWPGTRPTPNGLRASPTSPSLERAVAPTIP